MKITRLISVLLGLLAGAVAAAQPIINSPALFNDVTNPAATSNLSNMLTFANSKGRLVFETWGDSTAKRDGGGHEAGIAAGIYGRVPAAGVLLPPNHTASYNESHGMYRARRNDNGSTAFGLSQPQDLCLPGWPTSEYALGYDIPAIGVLPYSTTVVDGGDGLTNAQTTIAVGSTTGFASTGFILIDGEIVLYTGKTSTTFTGCTRASLGSSAATHAELAVVKQVTQWEAPNVGYLGKTTVVDGGDGITNVQNTIGVASTAGLSAVSGSRVRIDDEFIQYTGVTSTSLTGCTRGSLSSTAVSHSENAIVVQASTGTSGIEGMIYDTHPLGNGANYKQGIFWISTSTSAYAGAVFTPQIGTKANPTNLDGTITARFTGTAANFAGITAGTISHTATAATSASYGNTTWCVGTTTTNGLGPCGPAAVLWTGLFGTNRPVGAIQSCGISQGGKTLNTMLYELRRYNTGASLIPFDTALIQRYKAYIQTGAADLGGNGVVGLGHFAVFGHNEVSGQGFGGMVDPTEPWTVAIQTTLNGALNNSATTITLTSTSNLMATEGHVLIDSERIWYSAVSGNTLTGCIRGVYGTQAASHLDAAPVYQGYVNRHPLGFASDLLFDYKLHRSCWQSASGSTANFWYVYAKPIPTATTKTFIAPGAIPATLPEREGKFVDYRNAINTYLGNRDGFMLLDCENAWPGGLSVTQEYGASTSDQIHNTKAAYEMTWHRLMAGVPVR